MNGFFSHVSLIYCRQWALFDTRTQMMKGLFMAETAYRKYLRALFGSFDEDKIQYAELRPNFMAANSVSLPPPLDQQEAISVVPREWRANDGLRFSLPGDPDANPRQAI